MRPVSTENAARCCGLLAQDRPVPLEKSVIRAGLVRSKKPTFDCPGGNLSAGVEAELSQNIAYMRFDRPLAEKERLSDLAVRFALGHQRGHFLFSSS